MSTTASVDAPALMSAAEAARYLGISKATFHRKNSAGLVPPSVRTGGVGRPKWRRAELAAWVTAGMPAAKEWAGAWEKAAKRVG